MRRCAQSPLPQSPSWRRVFGVRELWGSYGAGGSLARREWCSDAEHKRCPRDVVELTVTQIELGTGLWEAWR
jgi:hypothetical protein